MINKVHSSSQGNVPFSWENKPGVSKAAGSNSLSKQQVENNHHVAAPLPPPPCPPETNGRHSFHDIQIPLPPCAFQPLSRSLSRKGLKKMTTEDDPFLIAYREVTKTEAKGKSSDHHEFGLFKSNNMSIFSCKKSSCGVMEDSIVRLSKVAIVSKSPKSEFRK